MQSRFLIRFKFLRLKEIVGLKIINI